MKKSGNIYSNLKSRLGKKRGFGDSSYSEPKLPKKFLPQFLLATVSSASAFFAFSPPAQAQQNLNYYPITSATTPVPVEDGDLNSGGRFGNKVFLASAIAKPVRPEQISEISADGLITGPFEKVGPSFRCGAKCNPSRSDSNSENRIFIKIVYGGKPYLWDSTRKYLTPWVDSYAKDLQKYLLDEVKLAQSPEPDQKSQIVVLKDRKAASDPSPDLNFTNYYDLTSNGITVSSFDLVVSWKKMSYVATKFCNGSEERYDCGHLAQDYSAPPVVFDQALSDTNLLLIVRSVQPGAPLYVFDTRFLATEAFSQSKGLALGDNIYIFPESLVAHSLDKVKSELKPRYDQVQKLMRGAAHISPAPPTLISPVSASVFFSPT